MTVEYFTPSKEEIDQAHILLHFYRRWDPCSLDKDHFPGQSTMTIFDFTDCFTPEERQAHRNWFLLVPTVPKFSPMLFEERPSKPKDIAVEFTALMDFGESPHGQGLARKMITRGKSKDFTPVPVLSVLPPAQIKPSYQVRGTKTINGQKVIFYGQDLPKDKS